MRIQLYAVPGLSSKCGLICCCRVRGPSGRLLSCRFVPARMGCAAEFMPTRRSGARTRIAAGPGQPGRCRAAGGRRFQPHAASTPSTLYPSWFVSTEWRFKWCCSAFILVWTAFSAAFDLFGRRGIYICFSSLHCQKIYKKTAGCKRDRAASKPRRAATAVDGGAAGRAPTILRGGRNVQWERRPRSNGGGGGNGCTGRPATGSDRVNQRGAVPH